MAKIMDPLKRKGYNVEFDEDGQTNWDGDESKITIDQNDNWTKHQLNKLLFEQLEIKNFGCGVI